MRTLSAVLGLFVCASGAGAQSLLERSPNLYGVWTLDRGRAAFVFAHRFEFHEGGDELLNIPTLTLAVGLPLGLTAGLDYSSNSEVVTRAGGNENQLWLKRALDAGPATAAGLVAYNTAARSLDGAVSVRGEAGRVSLFGEGRAFSDVSGSGESGAAATVGAALGLTDYLALTADVGRVLTQDSFPAAWSAAVAVAIPGSPHTFSLQATNAGSLTLHGASHERPRGFSRVRYGFVFTVPLTGSRWARIFRPSPAPEAAETPPAGLASAQDIAARVEMRQIAYTQPEVRIRAGQSVEWTNRDPVVHTVTGDDASWGSGFLNEGDRFVHRFDRPGRYPYHCGPHPQMTAVVIVEPGA